jgi:carboxyl-terminal processing protease
MPVLAAACGLLDRVAPSEYAPAPWVQQYLDTALDFTEQWFYFKERVDWDAQRAQASARAKGATEFRQAHPAIDTMVRSLADRHSFFYVPSRTPGTSNPAPEVAFHRVLGKSFTSRIGYVWLPMFIGTNQPGRADSIQRAIAQVDSTPSLCGWIIDLRGNPGGYWAPMLAGLSPLLTEGGVGGYILRDPTQRYHYEVHPGAAGIRVPTGEYYEYIHLPAAYRVRNPTLPLAILQTSNTASAGEILIMALRDPLRATRSFGSATYGATSQPFSKVLVDTASIQITAGVFFDKFDGRFPNYVMPADQVVAGPSIGTSYVPGAATDAVIDAATAWLRTQAACSAADLRSQSADDGRGFWIETQRLRRAKPASEWPAGMPTPWRAGPVPIVGRRTLLRAR